MSFHWVVSNQSPQCVNTHASIYSNLILFNRFPHTYFTLNNSFSNIIIPSQRLVTMSASLRTQTLLRCLIIQVLNIKSLLPKCLIQSPFTSVHSNLEHGLAILTESFSPLRSVLHNLSCWSPKQKCRDKPRYSWYCLLDMCEKPVLTSSHLLTLAKVTKIETFKSQNVELIYVHFCLSDLDEPYIKMTGLMCRFQIWP